MNKKVLIQVYKSLLDFYMEHDKIPLSIFAREVGLPEEQALSLLNDFKVTVKPPPKKGKSKKIKKSIEPDESAFSLWFLKILALPFSISALVLSVFFSVTFLSKQFNPFLAVALSSTIVGFGTFCFEAMTLFGKRKSWGASILFAVIWVGIVCYSCGTSISALYESYLLRMYNKTVTLTETNANRELYSSYDDEEKSKLELMEDKRKRLDIQQGILEELNTMEKQKANKASYQNAYWAASQLEKEITTISERVSKLRELKQELLKKDQNISRNKAEDTKPDIYSWLAKIFKTSSDFMQFVLQAIPAVVLDIISPLALYLFLFLRKKEK